MEAAATLFIDKPRRANALQRRPVMRDTSRDQALYWTWSIGGGPFSGLDVDIERRVEDLVTTRLRLCKGSTLYRAGEPFASLYAIQAGSLKTVLLAEDGTEQVAGYHMAGDVIGLDGIGGEDHQCEAIAQEDSDVCVLPFASIEQLGRSCPAFQHSIHRYLSHEIARQSSMMLLLGTMPAPRRLATFLLELSQRYQARGYSASEFILRMTRQEIGSYLGLKLETVSRLLARFHGSGLIHVQGRTVKLLDHGALKRLAHTGWRWE